MLALTVVLLVITVLMAVLVTGLLRSHADIVKALHSLGVGVGDPGDPVAAAGPAPVSIRSTPPGPQERSSTTIHDLEGQDPAGNPLVVSVSRGRTLLAFLSSGCVSCQGFWDAAADPAQVALMPQGVRIVLVTKGPEWESPTAIEMRSPGKGITVMMSTQAWSDYEVQGSPYFALIDGEQGTRVGEGVGQSWASVAEMVTRSEGDETRAREWASRGAPTADGLNGAEREIANDEMLLAAGITPGHPSLYPRSLDDVFASTSALNKSAEQTVTDAGKKA